MAFISRTCTFLFFFIISSLLTSLVSYGQNLRRYALPAGISRDLIAPDLVVIKIGATNIGSSAGRINFNSEEVLRIVTKKVHASKVVHAFSKKYTSNARVAVAGYFSNIYMIELPKGTDVIRAVNEILKLDGVIYAEPYYVNKLLYTPNDPNIGSQNHLPVIKALEAWDLERGDSTIVIGMVDTGVDMDHPDLGNIAYNESDPVNGVDDDQDGYVDNYFGWDLGDKDNDPNADSNGHGSLTTGVASARTNNHIGIAGVGFKSKYLPIKILKTSTNRLVNSYEGIIYAAEHGCKVINLSWGGVYPWFQYGQDVINYAVEVHDAVVVAAAGNTPEELDFYPASFDNVLSVGATDVNDNKAGFSTYSYKIDVMAMGNGTYTTNNAGGYTRGYGTSFAAPQVAGAAALIRARYPNLSARQVMEQIRISADDIYEVGSNMDYLGMLGNGRLNVYQALIDTLSPSVRQIYLEHRGSYGEYVFYNDTLKIHSRVQNFLYPAKDVEITLTCLDENVYIDQGNFHVGNLATLDTAGNYDDQFIVRLGESIGPGEPLVFRLDINGDGYDDYQYFTIETTPEYFPVSSGDAELSIASDGDLGYNTDSLYEGKGVNYQGKYLADWLGLIIAADSLHVSDNVVNNYPLYTKEKDFEYVEHARLYNNSGADLDARSIFTESDIFSDKIGIQVEQKILGWNDDSEFGYFVLEYRIINTTDSVIDHLNAGLFADWDLNASGNDAADWDPSSGIGYVYDKDYQNLFTGLATLTPGDTSYYALDIGGENGNTAEIDSVFSDSEKYGFLSGDVQKREAGVQGAGNDVAHILGLKNMVLQPGEGKKVAFVMLFGNDLNGLKNALQSAKSHYNDYLNHPPLEEYFHACYGDSAEVNPYAGEMFEFYADPFMNVRLDSGIVFRTPPVYDDQLYYIVNTDSGFRSDIRTIKVLLETPSVDFSISNDTLLIDAGTENEIVFTNISENTSNWLWDFGNNYGSTVENPSTFYNQPGQYEIRLIASNLYHCSDTVTKPLLVAKYGSMPDIDDRLICKGDTVHLQASNTDLISVYADAILSNFLFKGESFISGPLLHDSVFYIVNTGETFNSLPAEVNVDVQAPEVGFDYLLDTLNLNEKYLLQVSSKNTVYESISWFINDQPAGNSDPEEISYDGMHVFEIAQVLEDVSGCTDTARVTLTPKAGLAPDDDTRNLCRGVSVEIIPANGHVFYFYTDVQLSQLVHKGSGYLTGPVSESQSIYVTCMDGLSESLAADIKLIVSDLKADFSFSSDTLNLCDGDTVILKDESIDASWSYWNLISGVIDTSSILYEQFEQTGIYSYELIAGDNYNCVDTVQKDLVVVNITGLTNEGIEKLELYPNPVSSVVHLKIPGQLSDAYIIQLIGMDGKVVFDQRITLTGRSEYNLDVSVLRKGLYIIKISAEDLVYFGKFLKD